MRAAHNFSRHDGFTLVELLVVIGIIAVLIGLLLPTLNKAREAARQVKCMANMKQLASAVIQYANDNRSIMPGRASDPPLSFDYIFWQPTRNITDSALARYLSKDRSILESIFRCPSDNIDQRPNTRGTPFRYSYSMNSWVSSRGIGNLRRLKDIRNPSERIMLVCEDEKTLDDGFYNMEGDKLYDWLRGVSCNVLAARHEMKRKAARGIVWTGDKTTSLFDDCRGNVAFCDGHVQIFSRRDALRPRYTGSPSPSVAE